RRAPQRLLESGGVDWLVRLAMPARRFDQLPLPRIDGGLGDIDRTADGLASKARVRSASNSTAVSCRVWTSGTVTKAPVRPVSSTKPTNAVPAVKPRKASAAIDSKFSLLWNDVGMFSYTGSNVSLRPALVEVPSETPCAFETLSVHARM